MTKDLVEKKTRPSRRARQTHVAAAPTPLKQLDTANPLKRVN